MLDLPITAEMLSEGRSRLSLLAIEVVMLFPDDPGLRKRVLAAGRIWLSLAAAQGAHLSAEDMREMHEAPTIAEMQEKATKDKRFERGSLAGTIFQKGIWDRGREVPRGIQAIKSEISEKAKGTIPAFDRLSAETIETAIWKKFRGVAHIWAAWNQYVDMWITEKRKDTANAAANLSGFPPFPCHVNDVELFLSLAERFREMAEATTATDGRKTRPLQVPADTWRVPPDIWSGGNPRPRLDPVETVSSTFVK
jgi:hypothetical protein